MHAADREVVRRAQQGDDGAFHGLVDRYAGRLFRFAFSLVGNAADAEDVVQETFLGAFRGLASFEQRSSVETWLFRIAVRQAAKSRRSRGRRRTVSLDHLPESRERDGWSPEKVDTRLDVMAVLATLSPEHREVVVLREFEGMSYAEMADVLDVPRGTVESRLFRAREKLKERLSGYLP